MTSFLNEQFQILKLVITSMLSPWNAGGEDLLVTTAPSTGQWLKELHRECILPSFKFGDFRVFTLSLFRIRDNNENLIVATFSAVFHNSYYLLKSLALSLNFTMFAINRLFN